MRRDRRSLRILTTGIFVAVSAVASACPNCKSALDSADAASAGTAEGFYFSTLLMLGLPYTLAGIIVLAFYGAHRRSKSAQRRLSSTARS